MTVDPERIRQHYHTGPNDGGRLSGAGGGAASSWAAPESSTPTIGALDDIGDVNAPSPTDGDLLAWDSTPGEWINVAPPSGSVPSGTDPGDLLVWDGAAWDVLPIGTDADVLTADSGEALGLKYATPSVGSVTHAYIGYNTVGGSTENMITRRQYMKQVTLASNCLVTSIGAYIKQNSTNKVVGMTVGVLSDNAGSPELVIATGANDTSLNSGFYATNTGSTGAARWLHAPIGVWLVAGDYWLSVEFEVQTTGDYVIYYDGSGGDRYFTNNALRISDSGWTTVTTSSKKYSIRASTIS